MGKDCLIVGILAAIALASCSDAQPSEELVEAAPSDALPEGLALPQDTRIASRTEVNTDAGQGVVVLLDSEASAEVLEDHFRAEAESAGFTVTVETNSMGERQLVGEREDGMQFDFAVATYVGTSTRASLAVGRERSN